MAAYLGAGMALTTPAVALSISTIICEMGGDRYADNIYIHDENDTKLPNMTTFVEVSDSSDTITQVIAHCASGQAVRYDDNMTQDAYDAMRRTIDGQDAFTLRQLATRMKQKGADARYVTNAKRHCACRPETHKPSF
ncbi:MAG: hypothetical protein AB8B82_06295 [Roseovarius sp.]